MQARKQEIVKYVKMVMEGDKTTSSRRSQEGRNKSTGFGRQREEEEDDAHMDRGREEEKDEKHVPNLEWRTIHNKAMDVG